MGGSLLIISSQDMPSKYLFIIILFLFGIGTLTAISLSTDYCSEHDTKTMCRLDLTCRWDMLHVSCPDGDIDCPPTGEQCITR